MAKKRGRPSQGLVHRSTSISLQPDTAAWLESQPNQAEIIREGVELIKRQRQAEAADDSQRSVAHASANSQMKDENHLL